MLWNKIEKNNHGKLAYHVWDLLAAKITTNRSLLHRKYPAAWRQPTRGTAPSHMRWSVRREKWTFFQSLATDDVKKNNIPEKFLLTPINNWIVLTVRWSVNYFPAPNSSIFRKDFAEEKETSNSKAFCFTNKRKKSWTFQHQHLRQVKMYFYLFLFHGSNGVCIYVCCGKSIFKEKISTRVNQRMIKSSSKKYVTRTWFKFWPMKNIFFFYIKHLHVKHKKYNHQVYI